MSDVFKLIEKHGIELHGDIEYFAELVRQEERGYKTPLSVLNLTVRAEHLLKRGRVHDVETLRAMDARDILAIPELGKKTLKEISEALLEYEHLAERKRMQEQRTKDQEAEEGVSDNTIKQEHAKAIVWMMDKGYATGHGDSVVDLLQELEWQAVEREREACAKLLDDMAAKDKLSNYYAVAARAIRERGEK